MEANADTQGELETHTTSHNQTNEQEKATTSYMVCLNVYERKGRPHILCVAWYNVWFCNVLKYLHAQM